MAPRLRYTTSGAEGSAPCSTANARLVGIYRFVDPFRRRPIDHPRERDVNGLEDAPLDGEQVGRKDQVARESALARQGPLSSGRWRARARRIARSPRPPHEQQVPLERRPAPVTRGASIPPPGIRRSDRTRDGSRASSARWDTAGVATSPPPRVRRVTSVSRTRRRENRRSPADRSTARLPRPLASWT